MDTAPENKVIAEQRSGIIAVVGRTNVGKSTLVNAVLGEKISIVTPVVQTTRNIIRGILTEPRGQLVFLDTPGIHKAESELGRIMNRSARSSAKGTDAVMMVFDSTRRPRAEDEGWIRRALFEDVPVIAILNKIDEAPDRSKDYLACWKRLAEEKSVQKEIPWLKTSAVEGQGINELVSAFFELMPPGPYLFPEDVLTDFPRLLNIADIVREKLFMRLHDELPHAVAVAVEKLDELDDGSWNIACNIYVNRASQKGIVIGHKGRLLKSVTYEAEKDIAEVYERRIKLSLWVKVEQNWSKNFWMLKKMGYA